jgi:hypothetical protein
MERREADFSPVRVFRSIRLAQDHDANHTKLSAYVTANRFVFGREFLPENSGLELPTTVNILLPNERGWRSKAMRVLADDISYFTKSVVVMPDLFRGKTDEPRNLYENALRRTNSLSVADRRQMLDDLVAALQFARDQFQPVAMSIYGVGVGGGLALELACDLQAIACFDTQRLVLRHMLGLPMEEDEPDADVDLTDPGTRNHFAPQNLAESQSWDSRRLVKDPAVQELLERRMFLRRFPASVQRERRKSELAWRGIHLDKEKYEEVMREVERSEHPELNSGLTEVEERERREDLAGSGAEQAESEEMRQAAAQLAGDASRAMQRACSPRDEKIQSDWKEIEEEIRANPFLGLESERQVFVDELLHMRIWANHTVAEKVMQSNSELSPAQLRKLQPHSLVVFNPTHFQREKIQRGLFTSTLLYQSLATDGAGYT